VGRNQSSTTSTLLRGPCTADASCLTSARSWRKKAEHLRDNAEAAYLTAGRRATLLREAEAAERQADWWLDAIAAH